jgi:hypothetical protein
MDLTFERDWARYALSRIVLLVDKPRDEMTDLELSVYTHATNSLAGGDPVIASISRGPGHRLCRVCLAEWGPQMSPDHVSGCPIGQRRDEGRQPSGAA